MAVNLNDEEGERRLQPFDVCQVMNAQNGELLPVHIMALMQYARNNPNISLHVELMDSFAGTQFVIYSSNIYIPAGETHEQKVYSPRNRITSGIIILDIQNRDYQRRDERVRIKVKGMRSQILTFEIKAPDDKNLQCYVMVTGTPCEPCTII